MFLSAVLAVFAQSSFAQWHSGNALNKKLEGRIAAYRATGPLRSTLQNFSQQQGVAVYLDRRVDPGQTLDIELKNQTVEESLFLIADKVNLGVCRLGDVFYVGPRERLAHLQVLREQAVVDLAARDDATRSCLLAKRPVSWPRLAEPDVVFQQLAADANVTVNYASFPHDLLPAHQFPSMTLLDRLTLLSFGFEQMVNVPACDESRILMQPVPQPEASDLLLRVDANPQQLKQLRQAFPELDIERQRDGLAFTALPIQVYDVARWLAVHRDDARVEPHPEGQRVVSLKTTASIGAILTSLAKQLKVELLFDPALRPALEQRVTVDQQRVSYEQLLKAVLESTNLSFQLTQQTLEISER